MRKGIVTTNPLYWMPFDIDLWLGELAGGLRPDQKGALMDLLMTAWRQNPPCTLQNDPGYLAGKSGLGRDWKKLSGPIMANFDVSDDGRLICRWLRKIYDEQLTKFNNRSRVGKRNRGLRDDQDEGGDEGGDGTNGGTDGSTAQGTDGSTNDGTNGTTNGDGSGTNGTPEVRGTENPKGFSSTDLALKESAPDALGVGRRASAAGKGLTDPYREADEAVNSDAARMGAEARALADEYYAALLGFVDDWRNSHEAEYNEARIAEIKRLGLFNRQITPKDESVIEEGVAERLRRENDWPSRATWTASRQRKLAAERETVLV